MLDRPGDAQRDVQLRGHRLAGLADLELTRVVAGVHRGTERRRRHPWIGESSTTLNFSALPTPRPPATTMLASVSSGRSPATAGWRAVIRAALAAGAGTSTVTCSPARAGRRLDGTGAHGDHRHVGVDLWPRR